MIGTRGGANALSHRDLYALSKITMQRRSTRRRVAPKKIQEKRLQGDAAGVDILSRPQT
jgi:hypothetical protein